MTEAEGTIKFYLGTRNYGIIETPLGDVWFAAVLLDHHEPYPEPEERVRVEIKRSKRGLRATRIIFLDPRPEHAQKQEPINAANGFKRATVKWFNRVKGYGFLTVGGLKEDIMIHATVCNQCQVHKELLEPGEAFAIRYERNDGRLRVTKIALLAG